MQLLQSFLGLKPYVSLYEKTINLPYDLERCPFPKQSTFGDKTYSREEMAALHPQAVTSNVYIQIRVLDLLIEKLIYHFSPDQDFPISDALAFCLEHGLSDNELITTFGVAEEATTV